MATKNVVNSIMSKWTTQKTIVVIIIAAVLLLGAVGLTVLDRVVPAAAESPFAGMPIQSIGGQFIDVNGDGMPDFVISAQVILNPGKVGFLAQPTPPVK
jgi:hypothetical protein